MKEAAGCWRLDSEGKSHYLQDPLLRDRFQLLDSAQVRELVDAGMTLGAHTVSHPILSRQPDELASREIIESWRELAKATGSEVWALAYPYGNPDTTGAREVQFAQEAEYSCAFMNIPGDLALAHRFSLPRMHVTADVNVGSFEAHISGFHESIRRRMRPAPAADVQIPAR